MEDQAKIFNEKKQELSAFSFQELREQVDRFSRQIDIFVGYCSKLSSVVVKLDLVYGKLLDLENILDFMQTQVTPQIEMGGTEKKNGG